MLTKSDRFRFGIKSCLLPVFFVLAIVGCVKGPEVTTLTRDTDVISFEYNKSVQTFTVRNNGAWSVRSDADWLSFSPSEGTGDGTSYQTVAVTAEHNSGAEREAIIYLSSSSSTLEITAIQGAGVFEVKSPVIEGAFRINNVITAKVLVPYSKAQGGEQIKVVASVEGEASAGISFEDYTVTIDSEGDGNISAPFSGTPSAMGEIVVNIKIYSGDQLLKEESLTATVMDETTLLLMTGTKFKWGGYYLEEIDGVKSNRGNEISVDDDSEENYSKYMVSCSWGDAGTVDLFGTNAAYAENLEAFRIARGLSGWTGYKVYEHPGYLKIGTGSLGGWVQTPALDMIEGTVDLTVEFEFFRWKNDDKEVNVSAVDGGTLIGGTLSTTTHEWIKMSCVVKDATSSTKIKWSAADLTTSGSRFTLRNIVISEAKELTEPLAVPEDIACTASETTLSFTWSGVMYATAYKVSLAKASSPQFIMSETVSDTKYTFEGLDSEEDYLFTVQAIYQDNEAFNSPVSEPYACQTLSNLPYLPTPQVKVFKNERKLLVFEWTVDNEMQAARKFAIELRNQAGEVLRHYDVTYSAQYRANRFTFGKVDLSTNYTCAVKFISESPSEYNDSKWGTCDVVSAGDVSISNLVFYEDFNEMWMSGDFVNLSYGPKAIALKEYTAADDNFSGTAADSNPASNCTDVFGPTTANAAYREAYWSAWKDDFDVIVSTGKSLTYNAKIYPVAGAVKYGTGSANGALTLPALKALTGPTDIKLTFGAHPYVLPSSTGSLNVTASEGLKVTVSIMSGSGTIEGADSDGKLVLTNLSPSEYGAEEKNSYEMTRHEVVILGADSDTRITIASGEATAYESGKNRIWLDDIVVVKK